ncbi:hypothetical protein GSI_12469 [Ganoderma sinense ZZ0214-1]|uniref:Uncharacterized protein n=1 Tax=Ganoderma sinense ZZ0214-1 TaxID=1077348 RepID=A0A2G8RSU3_9APHY|nr:hypothetical protein GSI_12469 [Ganoderma sinense ZZ0214-1]
MKRRPHKPSRPALKSLCPALNWSRLPVSAFHKSSRKTIRSPSSPALSLSLLTKHPPLTALLSFTPMSLSLAMPPGPKENIYRQHREYLATQTQQTSKSKPGKAKTTTQQTANTASTATTNKRVSDTNVAPDGAEVKRRRAIAAGGAPPPDPDGNPPPGVIDEDDEPEPVRPKNPAWATAVWALDANANQSLTCEPYSETTRMTLGYQKIYAAIRLLLRLCSEYTKHAYILTYGIKYHAMSAEDRPRCGQDAYNDDVEAEELWPLWAKHFPELEDHLDYLADNPPLIVNIANFAAGVASKVRSDDLGRINDRIVDLCALEDAKLLNIKDNRGWQDSRTGRLLCPVRYLSKFDSDPGRFCKHVRNRLVRIFSTDYPSFLYDLSLVNADDPVAGFLRGEVLVNVYKSMMTGKSSVLKASGRAPRGQKSVAAASKLREVNLHSIIYVALLARSALGDREWSDVDGKFWKAENFVSSIAEITWTFPAWYNETIGWWNRQIFGDDNELDSDAERDLEDMAFYTIMARQEVHGASGLGTNENDSDGNGNNTSSGSAGGESASVTAGSSHAAE